MLGIHKILYSSFRQQNSNMPAQAKTFFIWLKRKTAFRSEVEETVPLWDWNPTYKQDRAINQTLTETNLCMEVRLPSLR